MSKSKSNGKSKTPRAPRTFTHEDFVKTWQTASTVNGAAEKLGVSRNVVSQLAVKMRKGGVKLKRMTKQPVVIDAAALNKLIK